MRGFRKINRRLVLFLIILAILVTYLTVLELSRISQKAEIKEVCLQVTDLYSQCIVIPPELYLHAEGSSEEAFQKYEEECYNKLAPMCCETNTVRSILEYALENQLHTDNYITGFGNALIENIAYFFDGDTVTVQINTTLNYRSVYSGLEENTGSGMSIVYPCFSFMLQKEDGKWKLLAFDPDISSYSSGGFDSYNSYYGGLY